MLATILKWILGDKNRQDIQKILPIVEKIKHFEPQVQQLSADDLRSKTKKFQESIQHHVQNLKDKKNEIITQLEKTEALKDKKKHLQDLEQLDKDIDQKISEKLNEILPEAFAILKETTRRLSADEEIRVLAQDFDRKVAEKKPDLVRIEGDFAVWKTTWQAGGNIFKWNMVYYDVQLIGGIVLHEGKIAEMQTGEGKTLVSTLPVYLNALTGKGVHVVTVNDYLAKRDADWMGPLYLFHGLSVECIEHYPSHSQERKQAYQADITFGTNNEFGFDYLRDNMSTHPEELVQRNKPYFAIVDEVDSVLIDEARTPLIISGPVQGGHVHHFSDLKDKVEMLVRSQQRVMTDLLVEAKKILKDQELNQLDKKTQEDLGVILLKCHRAMPKNKAFIKLLSEMGMKALLQKTENYYLQDHAREMPKIDEALYFVLNEKQNNIDLTQKGIELVSKDVAEDFFILPDMGVTFAQIEQDPIFTAEEKIKEKEKIHEAYRIKSERIHTMSQLLKAYTLFEKDKEYVVMNQKVMIVDEQTGRIMDGRRYSDGLHQAIEAKENVKIEASTQTYASITLQNYFRMYEKLAGMTGTARTEASEFWEIYRLDVVAIPTNKPVIRKDHDDSVYKTIREKYNAVIVKIEEERLKKRACLVGTTSVEVSELLSRMLKQRGITHNVLNAKYHAQEADIIAEAGREGAITIATNMAGRGTDIKLSSVVKENGGLVIIGTERHESRRIDLQLRGRAGRQGDPGDSYFFVSLEDDLMRMFGSEKIASIMDRLGIQEGELIQHPMVSNSIQRAQKKVEENNFGVRKRLLEYDNVMNSQREIVYKRRKNALFGTELEIDITDMFTHLAQKIAQKVKVENDPEVLTYEMGHLAGILDFTRSKTELQRLSLVNLQQTISEKLTEHYLYKKQKLAEFVHELIKQQDLAQLKKMQKNILIPFTDGQKMLQIPVDLETTLENKGTNIIQQLEQGITIAMIDFHWKEHLRQMDELRSSVQMSVHEQKDPLLIYKFKGFELFNELMHQIYEVVTRFMSHARVPIQEREQNIKKN